MSYIQYQTNIVDYLGFSFASNLHLLCLTAVRLGALVKPPFRVTSYTATLSCAMDCLSFPPLQCQSFNYDYGSSGRCELMEAVESHDIKVHKVVQC